MSKHYVNTIGTEIIVDTKSPVAGATSLILRVKKPVSGNIANWEGIAEGNTKIKYVVKSGDWNEVGEYKLQAYMKTPSGEWLGETKTFPIEDVFK